MSDSPPEDQPADETDESRNLAFTAVLGVFALVGVAAVVVGFGGLFVVLTGGTADDGPPEIRELEQAGLQCSAFDGDPEVGHEGSVVATERGGTLLDGVSTIPDNDNLLITMTGSVVNASAAGTDGTARNVTVGDDSIIIEGGATGPDYRVWVDSVDEEGAVQEGAVVRSQLDICP